MKTARIPIFQERIRELRGDMTQGQFAEKIGVSRPTIGLYESGARIPDAEVLRDISEKCNVSADWLLGLAEIRTANAKVREVCKYTGLSEQAILALTRNERYKDEISRIIVSLLEAE